MSNLREIKHLKKLILERTLKIQELKKERKILLDRFYKLKDQYEDEEISKEQYLHLRSTLLDGKSLDYGISYYDSAIEILSKEIALYNSRKHQIKESIAKQSIAFALSIGFMIMFMTALSTPFDSGITGYATSGVSEAEAVIQIYYAIDLSENLDNGITFDLPELPLGTTNNNATDNYNGAESNTTMYVIFSEDSNVNIDMCTAASGPFSTGVSEISESNMKWSDDMTNNATLPDMSSASSYSTEFASGAGDLDPGTNAYYRFWLDVPPATPPGDYNNTIIFKAVQQNTGC